MRYISLVALLTTLAIPAHAERPTMRSPSCETLAAFALAMRADPIELIFGRPVKAMSLDQFEQALDIVTVCMDEIESGPDDEPGMHLNERKRPRLVALGLLAEDLRIYRNQRRERERRAAQTTGPAVTQ